MQKRSELHGHRALGLSALGVLIALVGGFFVYQGSATTEAVQASDIPSAYQYSVKQSARADVSYMDSSFFDKAPTPDNHAYVSDLTNDIAATFHYEFIGSAPVGLTTSYSVKAEVKSNYALKGNTEESSNVWKQEYLLIKPTTIQVEKPGITLDKTVTVPYAEYKKAANQFRTTLSLPTSSETVVTLNVRTTGIVDGTPFEDVRVSTIATPLEEQIYQPVIKFDKEDTKRVVAPNAQQSQSRLGQTQLYGGAAVAFAGLALTSYGLRKRIFKSTHRRKLDKIYRYHDGIIVRTSRPVELTDHQVVPMRSFDDMLNLEAELKSPIIADEISSTLTHFLIVHNSVVYLYKLDDDTNHAIATRTTSQALATTQQPRAAREVLKPIPAATSQPIATAPADDDWGEILKELDTRPLKKPGPHKKKIQ